MTSGPSATAQALARAFLAGEWDPPAMARRGRAALATRRRFVRLLADAARSAYPDRPADRSRELARFLAACPPFEEAVVRRVVAAPSEMGPTPWPVLPLPTLGTLGTLLGLDAGELGWFADLRSLERGVPDEALRHYRYRWAATRFGVRLIEAPKPRLAAMQRRLLREVLDVIPPAPAAHGFRPGRSVHTYAAPHAGQAVVVHLDLEAFFASVRASRVFGLFRTAGYPEAVAHVLTALCTNVVPAAVWRAAPRPADPSRLDAHRRLGRRLATPHLPQGAPTSPALANLAAHRLDIRLSGLAASMDARYTRYADDLAFSGSRDLARAAPGLIRLVGEIAADEGFRLHPAKTSLRWSSERQVLGGLVVNERPRVSRKEIDRLRAIVHNVARFGPASQNRDGHHDFRAHLLGRIAWVAASDPERARRLRQELAGLEWPTATP